jgi:molybdenum-dependent DNA-binding transcriptional regulator ModE
MSHSHDPSVSLLCNTIDAAALTSVTGGKSSGDSAERLKLQKLLQEKSQAAKLVSQVAAKRHQASKAIIDNIR